MNVDLHFEADLNTSAWIMKAIIELADDKDTITRKTGINHGELIWDWSFYGISYSTSIEILKILEKKEELPKIDDPTDELFKKRDMFRKVKKPDKR